MENSEIVEKPKNKKVKRVRIDFAEAAKYFLFLLAIHFFFFGFVCNIYKKDAGYQLLFVYRSMFEGQGFINLFSPDNPITDPNYYTTHYHNINYGELSFISTFILIFIVATFAFTEDFLVIAVKKSLWAIPIIVASSIFWFWLNYIQYYPAEGIGYEYTNYVLPDYTGLPMTTMTKLEWWEPAVMYFTSWDALWNILILGAIIGASAILGGFLKIKYRERFKKRSVLAQ